VRSAPIAVDAEATSPEGLNVSSHAPILIDKGP
jgi:hypothetical protein